MHTLSQRLRDQREVSLQALSLCWNRLFEMDDRRERFLCYLVELYHYVKFSCPLMQQTLDKLPADAESTRRYLTRHIEEETGHEQWVLADLQKLGFSPVRVKAVLPMRETLAMVGTQLYLIDYVDPRAYFGYIYALESSASPIDAVEKLSLELDIPLSALFTLTEHADLDWTHHVKALNRVLDSCFPNHHHQELIMRSYLDTMESLSDLVLGLCYRTNVSTHLAALRTQDPHE